MKMAASLAPSAESSTPTRRLEHTGDGVSTIDGFKEMIEGMLKNISQILSEDVNDGRKSQSAVAYVYVQLKRYYIRDAAS